MEDPGRRATNVTRLLGRTREMLEKQAAGGLLPGCFQSKIASHLSYAREQCDLLKEQGAEDSLDVHERTIDELSAIVRQHKSRFEAQVVKERKEKDRAAAAKRLADSKAQESAAPKSKTPEIRRRGASRKPTVRDELLSGSGAGSTAGQQQMDQEKVQSEITEDMASMAGKLKEIARGVGETLEEQNTLVADANEVAEKNEKLTDTANVKLAEQVKRSGGCWLWLLLLGVLINFVAMVIFMKTVKLGY